MVFSPIWQEGGIAPANAESALETVAAAADRLVRRLDTARGRTNNWSDQQLGYALVESALSECLVQLAKTELWGRANQVPSDIMWRKAESVLRAGWLQLRAREKPLGYAGDYELLTRIVETRCCDDPLGRLFDRYFLAQAAPLAVRNRTEQAAHALAAHRSRNTQESYQVASVGAGSGIDVERGLELLPVELRDSVEVTLFDLDERGLAYATERVARAVPTQRITSVRENLFRLARKPKSPESLGVPNFLICSGLFDYLEDEAAVELLQLFWDQLAADGHMLVGNFVPTHPTRAYMEWIGNWYLRYRTVSELWNLAETAGIPRDNCHVAADRTGVDLFLVGIKP